VYKIGETEDARQAENSGAQDLSAGPNVEPPERLEHLETGTARILLAIIYPEL
jgi:hypothetical protein